MDSTFFICLQHAKRQGFWITSLVHAKKKKKNSRTNLWHKNFTSVQDISKCILATVFIFGILIWAEA